MKQLVALMGVVFLISSCGQGPRHSIEIADVTRPMTLTLGAPRGHGSINYLTLEIRGRINGHAQVSFADSVTNGVGGRFAIERNGNYGGTNCVVRYVPQRVTSGTVSIRYSFD